MRAVRRRRPVAAVSAILTVLSAAAGCGDGDFRPHGSSGEGVETVRAFQQTWFPVRGKPLWLVLIVDDAPTDTARALRQLVADLTWRHLDEAHPDRLPAACSQPRASDPAAFWPVDLRITLFGASAPDAPRADLRLATENLTASLAADWRQQLAAAFQRLRTASRGRARYLDALKTAFPDGTRAGRGSVELVAVVAASRPDASDWSAAALEGSLPPTSAILHPEDLDERCGSRATSYPAVRLIAEPTYKFVAGCAPGDPATADATSAYEIRFFADRAPCHGCREPLPTLPGGRVACRMVGYTSAPDGCPEDRGWLNPVDADGVRRPRQEVAPWDPNPDRGETLHVCEVRQLEGQALSDCRARRECQNCEPGWCYRVAWEDDDSCGDTTHDSRVRFVLGADTAPGAARLVLKCQESMTSNRL